MFLDDLRPCPEGFLIARTIEDAINIISRYPVKIISLDHDLGGVDGSYQKTGYDFCKWLVEKWVEDKLNCTALPEIIYLHTSNPVGRDNMFQLLNRYKPDYVKVHRSSMPNYNLATGKEI